MPNIAFGHTILIQINLAQRQQLAINHYIASFPRGSYGKRITNKPDKINKAPDT